MLAELARFQERLSEALCSASPAEALARLARDESLDADTRAALAASDGDGQRMTALLVVRLRFERLLQADPAAQAWFERDPASFAAAFRRYHEQVPPGQGTPWDESRRFEAWRAT